MRVGDSLEDGRYLAYSVQDGGTDWRIVRVKDVATGQDLSDEVRWVKFSALDWAKDGSGFYYSRFPEPEQAEAFQSLNENHAVLDMIHHVPIKSVVQFVNKNAAGFFPLP